MPSCTLECPGCGTPVKVKLVDEVTAVQGPCGYVFLALRPDVDADALKKKEKTKTKKPAPPPPPPPLSLELLQSADDKTSASVISAFAKDDAFKAFAKAEMEGIVARGIYGRSKPANQTRRPHPLRLPLLSKLCD